MKMNGAVRGVVGPVQDNWHSKIKDFISSHMMKFHSVNGNDITASRKRLSIIGFSDAFLCVKVSQAPRLLTTPEIELTPKASISREIAFISVLSVIQANTVLLREIS